VFMQIPPAQQDFNHHLIHNSRNNEVIEPVTCCLLGPCFYYVHKVCGHVVKDTCSERWSESQYN